MQIFDAVKCCTVFEPSVLNPLGFDPTYGYSPNTRGMNNYAARISKPQTILPVGQLAVAGQVLICRMFIQWDISMIATTPVQMGLYRASPVAYGDLQTKPGFLIGIPRDQSNAIGNSDIIAELVDLPTLLPDFTAVDDPSQSLLYGLPGYFPTTVWTTASPEGLKFGDVTPLITYSQATGRRYATVRLREADETRRSWDVANFHCICTKDSSDPTTRPRLGAGTGITTVAPVSNPMNLDLTILEPIITIGSVLHDERQRQDFEQALTSMVNLVRRGNVVRIEVQIRDFTTRPGQWVDPTSVLVTLRASDGTVLVNAQRMSRMAIGIYQYRYKTLNTDPLGVVTAEITVT